MTPSRFAAAVSVKDLAKMFENSQVFNNSNFDEEDSESGNFFRQTKFPSDCRRSSISVDAITRMLEESTRCLRENLKKIDEGRLKRGAIFSISFSSL